jgi:hypothetical protein
MVKLKTIANFHLVDKKRYAANMNCVKKQINFYLSQGLCEQ